MAADGFINIPFKRGNLDRYLVRTSILNAIQKVSPLLKGNFLDVGCGKMPYRKYLLEHSLLLLILALILKRPWNMMRE